VTVNSHGWYNWTASEDTTDGMIALVEAEVDFSIAASGGFGNIRGPAGTGGFRPGSGGRGGSGCFLAGTTVLVYNSSGHESVYQNIEDIILGDLVWACDPVMGEWQVQTVVAPLVHEYSGDIVTIVVGESIVEATGNHPFWVVAGEELDSRPESCDVYEHERSRIVVGGSKPVICSLTTSCRVSLALWSLSLACRRDRKRRLSTILKWQDCTLIRLAVTRCWCIINR
jgi:hypothetical protein